MNPFEIRYFLTYNHKNYFRNNPIKNGLYILSSSQNKKGTPEGVDPT